MAAATAKASVAAHAAKIAAEPLRLVSITPGADARAANGAAGVTVTYNEPLPDSAAMPTLKPSIAGSWTRQGERRRLYAHRWLPGRAPR